MHFSSDVSEKPTLQVRKMRTRFPWGELMTHAIALPEQQTTVTFHASLAGIKQYEQSVTRIAFQL